MSDTRQDSGPDSLARMGEKYEALIRGLGLLGQLEDLAGEDLPREDRCTRIAALIAGAGIAEFCSIMLLDPAASYLDLRAVATRYSAQGFAMDPDIWHGKRFAMGEGIAGRVAATGTHMRIDDVLAHPDFLHLPDSPVGVRALMCFPLQYGDAMLGVINLSCGEPCYFDLDCERAMLLASRRAARILGPVAGHGGEESDAPAETGPREVLAVFDRDGNVLKITDNCTRLTGIEASQWQAGEACWRSRIVEADRIAYDAYYAELERGAPNRGVAFAFEDGSGTIRRLHEVAMPFPAAGANPGGYVAVVQEELDRASRGGWAPGEVASRMLHAQRVNTMGHLAGGIVHELSNLLMGVTGNLDLALTIGEPAKVNDLIERAREAGLRASHVVGKVLTFGHAGAYPGTREPVEVRRLLEDAAGVLRCSLESRIALEMDAPPALDRITGDKGQLLQVLLNLGVNARDALERPGYGGGEAPPRIRLGAENVHLGPETPGPWGNAVDGDFMRLYVTDNGTGMTPQVRARVYEPFFSTKPAGQGTGLGLPTAYRIVRHHNGWLDLHSAPGKGTTVNVYLPADARAAVPKSDAPAEQRSDSAPDSILIVDDEPLVRNLGVAILQRLGYNAIPAANGREALACYDEPGAEISLVILDLQMPDMGGEVVLKELRARNPDLPVIYSTGMSRAEAAEWSPDIEPTAFLKKPYLIATMAEVVREALANRVRAPST